MHVINYLINLATSNQFNYLIMKAKSFKRAVELLKRLDFEEFEVNENLFFTGQDGEKYYQNWFSIYMDDDNGSYVAELRENGKWFLTYDGDVVCLISGEIAEKLDDLRDEELAKLEDDASYQYERQLEYADMRRKSMREEQIFGL